MNVPMEVLCILPKHPLGMPLGMIAEDLGFEGQSEVRDAIAKLNGRGIKVEVHNGDKGMRREASIMPQSWQAAQELGNEYWLKTHSVMVAA